MRHKEEQRRAAASLLILLIVAQGLLLLLFKALYSTSVLGESACYDACEGYCQTLLFEEFTLALFDPSSNTRVLSGVEVQSQIW